MCCVCMVQVLACVCEGNVMHGCVCGILVGVLVYVCLFACVDMCTGRCQ